jgi:hypothetical protein
VATGLPSKTVPCSRRWPEPRSCRSGSVWLASTREGAGQRSLRAGRLAAEGKRHRAAAMRRPRPARLADPTAARTIIALRKEAAPLRGRPRRRPKATRPSPRHGEPAMSAQGQGQHHPGEDFRASGNPSRRWPRPSRVIAGALVSRAPASCRLRRTDQRVRQPNRRGDGQHARGEQRQHERADRHRALSAILRGFVSSHGSCGARPVGAWRARGERPGDRSSRSSACAPAVPETWEAASSARCRATQTRRRFEMARTSSRGAVQPREPRQRLTGPVSRDTTRSRTSRSSVSRCLEGGRRSISAATAFNRSIRARSSMLRRFLPGHRARKPCVRERQLACCRRTKPTAA